MEVISDVKLTKNYVERESVVLETSSEQSQLTHHYRGSHLALFIWSFQNHPRSHNTVCNTYFFPLIALISLSIFLHLLPKNLPQSQNLDVYRNYPINSFGRVSKY